MKNKRPGAIFPIIIVAFLITIILFTVGGMYIGNNARMINKVKDHVDYKTVLSNFHELSYAKITEIASSTQNFDGVYNNSNPSEGFGTFINNFETQLNDSVFTDQWLAVTSKMDAGSDHRLILSYTESATAGNALVEAFAMYVDDLNYKDDIANCESVLIKLDGTDYKSLMVCKLELSAENNNRKMFSAALIQKAHYSQQFFYFTEVEDGIWFTDGELIDGPVGSMDTINISGNPVFKGTVFYNPEKDDYELPGFNLDNNNPNSNGVFLGDPEKTPLPTDTSFAEISSDYQDKIEKDFVSLAEMYSLMFYEKGISASYNNKIRRSIENIPAGLNSLTVEIMGNNGDADVYVAMNRQPETYDYEGSYSFRNYSNEKVTINNPTPGTCHIMIHADYSFNNLTLEVTTDPPSLYNLFAYDTYASYTNLVPETFQLDFSNSQSLMLDLNPSDYEIDFNENEIKIDWKYRDDSLKITFKEKINQENLYEATFTYNDGDETYITSGIPFSGFISAANEKIYLGDHDNSQGGNLCFYNGKISLQTTEKIYIEDHIIPSELNQIAGFSLEPTTEWTEEKTSLVKEYMKNNVNSSLNLISDDYIYIGSENEYSKNNHKIFASLISFKEKIKVAYHDYYNLGYKGQLTIIGSMMQRERGAVGTFDQTSHELFYDNHHDDYRIVNDVLQGRDYVCHGWGWNRICSWTNWENLYTVPEDKKDIYQSVIGWDWWGRKFVSIYYIESETKTGYYKNYHFDPRFSDGFTPGAGTPEAEGIDIIMSGLIEVY